jgi:hypothetical protein
MNFLGYLFLLPAIIVLNELVFIGVEGSARLTAITDVPHEYVHELYRKLRNEGTYVYLVHAAILDAEDFENNHILHHFPR